MTVVDAKADARAQLALNTLDHFVEKALRRVSDIHVQSSRFGWLFSGSFSVAGDVSEDQRLQIRSLAESIFDEVLLHHALSQFGELMESRWPFSHEAVSFNPATTSLQFIPAELIRLLEHAAKQFTNHRIKSATSTSPAPSLRRIVSRLREDFFSKLPRNLSFTSTTSEVLPFHAVIPGSRHSTDASAIVVHKVKPAAKVIQTALQDPLDQPEVVVLADDILPGACPSW